MVSLTFNLPRIPNRSPSQKAVVSVLIGKEALYTAATRAKKRWEIIGKKEILQKLLMKKSVSQSGFKECSVNYSI